MQYFSFQWHITDYCDQRCKHCYIFSEGHPELLSVSVEQAKKVIDSCVEMCDKMGGRRPYFYVTGGDPLLHPQVWEILGMLKAREIPFTILGNPFHLTDENCQKLKFYGCEKYQLSIDGNRETHDFMRKPGSFDTTLEKIEVLHRNGIRVAIMTTISGVNADQMPEIFDTVVAHNADVFAFARYCPTSLEKSAHLTPQQYRQVLDTCWKKYMEYGENCKTTFNLKDHLWGLYLHEIGQFKIPDGLDEDTVYDGCNCGHGHFTILPNGDVMACRRFESKVGNVFDTPLYDLWTSPQMDYYRQYEKFEKCHDCELLRFCRVVLRWRSVTRMIFLLLTRNVGKRFEFQEKLYLCIFIKNELCILKILSDMTKKNQSDRLTSQQKENLGAVGIFGEEAKSHDVLVGDVSKVCLFELEKEFPQLAFRYRTGISKEEINHALQEVDKELGQTLFVQDSNIKPDGGLIEVKDDNERWRVVLVSEAKHQGKDIENIRNGIKVGVNNDQDFMVAGNAIERSHKNISEIANLMLKEAHFPYVLFLEGSNFLTEDITVKRPNGEILTIHYNTGSLNRLDRLTSANYGMPINTNLCKNKFVKSNNRMIMLQATSIYTQGDGEHWKEDDMLSIMMEIAKTSIEVLASDLFKQLTKH